MDRHTVEDAQDFLAMQEGLAHIRIRKHGRNLVLFSGDGDARQNHARLTEIGSGLWGVSLPHHSGRWDPLPGATSLDQALTSLVRDFRVYLHAW